MAESSSYFFAEGALKMKKIAVIMLLLSFFVYSFADETERDLEWYLTNSQEAVEQEKYSYAVGLLKEGLGRFPEAAGLNQALGDLFFNKELYKLALQEYLAADTKRKNDFDTLDQIQRCFSYLNEEYKAIEYLEKILILYPPEAVESSIYIAVDLGWMYFKTYQLEKGEALMLKTLESVPEDGEKRSLYMTLGTLYSGMYRYEESKQYYFLSIDEALDETDVYFASVAYYNLSLLELSFYNYDEAMKFTEESIELDERNTGHMARGGLYQLRLEYGNALKEFKSAMVLDTSPLSKKRIAEFYNLFGFPEKAMGYAEEVFRPENYSWMLNFGTDNKQYSKESHQLMSSIFQSMHRRQMLLPTENFFEDMGSALLYVWYGLNEYYHSQAAKSLSIELGKSYLEENNRLDAFVELYKGMNDYRDIALKYLNRAEQYETAIAPRAAPFYFFEKGKLLKDAGFIDDALNNLNPRWERATLLEALIAGIDLTENGQKRRELLNRAYALNPGGLFNSGFGLPLSVNIIAPHFVVSRLSELLKKAGSQLFSGSVEEAGSRGYRYALEIEWTQIITFYLKDNLTGKICFQETLPRPLGDESKQVTTFARILILEYLYNSELAGGEGEEL